MLIELPALQLRVCIQTHDRNLKPVMIHCMN